MKTFKQVINEVSIGDAGVRKDFPNVWAQKDPRMNSIVRALVNRDGYTTVLKSYKKDLFYRLKWRGINYSRSKL